MVNVWLTAAVLTHLPLANFSTYLWRIWLSIIRIGMYPCLHDIAGSNLGMHNTPDQASLKQSAKP
jgi:hypothetical protein